MFDWQTVVLILGLIVTAPIWLEFLVIVAALLVMAIVGLCIAIKIEIEDWGRKD
jgi:hypothetical protein